MTTQKKSFLSKLLKVLMWVTIVVVILVSSIVIWILWPQSPIKLEHFVQINPSGMLAVRFDPGDAEFARLIAALSKPGTQKESKFAADLIATSVEPMLVVVSYFDSVRNIEEVMGTLQLKRFGNPLAFILRGLADADPNDDLERIEGNVGVKPKREGDPWIILQKQGIIVASSERGAKAMSGLLATGRTSGYGEPTKEEQKLYGKFMAQQGHVTGYLANSHGRLRNFLELARKNGWATTETLDQFTPKVILALEDNLVGVVASGELQSGDFLGLQLRLVTPKQEAAEAVEAALSVGLVPQLTQDYPKAEITLERRDLDVVLGAKLPEFKKMLVEAAKEAR